MGQPTIDGFNTFIAAKTAKELGFKVSFSGVGADEILGTYPSFRRLLQFHRWGALLWSKTTRFLIGILAKFATPYWSIRLQRLPAIDGESIASIYLAVRCIYHPKVSFWPFSERKLSPNAVIEELTKIVDGAAGWTIGPLKNATKSDILRATQLAETQLYMRHQFLRDSDWASMHHSLELRVPFCNQRLSDALVVRQIREGFSRGKRPLAYCSKRPLPAAVLKRPKTGFSIPGDMLMREILAPAHRMPDGAFEDVGLSPAADLAEQQHGRHWSRGWAQYVLVRCWKETKERFQAAQSIS